VELFLKRKLTPLENIILATMSPYASIPRWLPNAIKNINEIELSGIGELLLERHLPAVFLKEKNSFDILKKIPQKDISNIGIEVIKTKIFSTAASAVCREIKDILEKKGIKHAFLKGAINCSLYSNHDSRCIGDIDILTTRSEAISLYRILLDNGYNSGEAQTFTEQSLHNHMSNNKNYELPALWRKVEIDIERYSEIEKILGNSSRFTVDKAIYANIPIEIHYELFPGHILQFDTQTIEIGSGINLAGLKWDISLLYTAYKTYADLVALRKIKAAKLFTDTLRIIHMHPEEIWTENLIKEAIRLNLGGILKSILVQAKSTYELPIPNEIIFSLPQNPSRWESESLIPILISNNFPNPLTLHMKTKT